MNSSKIHTFFNVVNAVVTIIFIFLDRVRQ